MLSIKQLIDHVPLVICWNRLWKGSVKTTFETPSISRRFPNTYCLPEMLAKRVHSDFIREVLEKLVATTTIDVDDWIFLLQPF